MDLQEFTVSLFNKVNNGYSLSTKPTPINDMYFFYNYVYDVIHAVAEYNEAEGLIVVYITVKGYDEIERIVEKYRMDGIKEEFYME